MSENKTENKNIKKEQEEKKKKPSIKPGDIEGKLEIPDTRERRDGPGGDYAAGTSSKKDCPRRKL